MRRPFRLSPQVGLAALLAAGCGVDRAAAPPDAAGLSDAEALLVGREVAGEVADLAGTLTIGSLLVPEFPSGRIAASAPDDPGRRPSAPPSRRSHPRTRTGITSPTTSR